MKYKVTIIHKNGTRSIETSVDRIDLNCERLRLGRGYQPGQGVQRYDAHDIADMQVELMLVDTPAATFHDAVNTPQPELKTFFTITDACTVHTNSRSERFPNYKKAEDSAIGRLRDNRADAVYVLKAVKLVERGNPPVKITDLPEVY